MAEKKDEQLYLVRVIIEPEDGDEYTDDEYLVNEETFNQLQQELKTAGCREFGQLWRGLSKSFGTQVSDSKRIELIPISETPISGLQEMIDAAKEDVQKQKALDKEKELLKMVRSNPEKLTEIPAEDQTEEICVTAVRKNWKVLLYAAHVTDDVILTTVQRHKEAIDLVPAERQTNELLNKIFDLDPTLFPKFKRQPYELCLKAATLDPSYIDAIHDTFTRETIKDELRFDTVTRPLQQARDILTQAGIKTKVVCPSAVISSHYLKTEGTPIPTLIGDDIDNRCIFPVENHEKITKNAVGVRFQYNDQCMLENRENFETFVSDFARESKLAAAGLPGGYPDSTCRTLLTITKHLEDLGLAWTAEKTEKHESNDTKKWPITIKTELPGEKDRPPIPGPEIVGFLEREGIHEGADYLFVSIHIPVNTYGTLKSSHVINDSVNHVKYREELNALLRDMEDMFEKMMIDNAREHKAEQQTVLGRGNVPGTNKIDTSRHVREDAKADNPPRHTAVKSADNPNR